MSSLRTEYPFTLPRGYVDEDGNVHRRGSMRLATARDEIEPLRDQRIEGPDDPFLTVLVLSRVIESLGDVQEITPRTVEDLFAVDLAYLQDFYGVINFGSEADVAALLDDAQARGQSVSEAGDDADPAEEGANGSVALAPAQTARRSRAAIEEVPAGDR